MIPKLLAFAFLMAGAPCTLAQLEGADKTTQEKCRQYLQTPLPSEANSITAPKQWPECNSYKLYSGLGTKVDFAAARKCAWSERMAIQANLEPRYTVASVFGGSAMLTTLYANGEGVDRNISLALRFACEGGWAPAEFSYRIDHLESIRSAAKGHFSFCDDITSGFMQGFCAAYQSEIADQDRASSIQRLEAPFTPAQRLAFQALRKTQEAYARAHAAGEIDTSGTARAMFQIDAENTLTDDFIEAIKSFESGKLPSGSPPDSRDADAHLNSAYRKAMNDADEHKNEYGAVQPDGIRNAERAWLKYRDAWIAFAKLRYPHVATDAWLALLSKDRASILDGSFCDMDAVDGSCARKGDTWKPSPLP